MVVASFCAGVMLQVLMTATLTNGQNFNGGVANAFSQQSPPYSAPDVPPLNVGSFIDRMQKAMSQSSNIPQPSNFGPPPQNSALNVPALPQAFAPVGPNFPGFQNQGPAAFAFQNPNPRGAQYRGDPSPQGNTFRPTAPNSMSSSDSSSSAQSQANSGSTPPRQTSSVSAAYPQRSPQRAFPPQRFSPPAAPPRSNGRSFPPHQTKRAPPPNSRRASRPRRPNFQHRMPPVNQDPLGGHKIVCIFNEAHGQLEPSMMDPDLCTHINYEFAKLDPKTYEMIPGDPDKDNDRGFYQQAIDLKKKNPKLKVLIAIGGWTDSTKKYSELAEDEALRSNFVEKTVDFIRKHGFDGLDFAWEYPNCWQGALGVHPPDKENFLKLLKQLKEAFSGDKLLLSVSVTAIPREIEAAYMVPEMSELVDHINVMTYDMHGPWEGVTGHHQQFKPRPNDDDQDSNVQGAMNAWVEKGAPKKKLLMGIACYAVTYTLADPNDCGMGAPTIGPGNPGSDSDNGGFLFYNEMCQYMGNGTWTEKEDEYAGFYAYCDDQWACYDPPLMMVRKTKYVIQSKFGGILMKHMGADDFKGKCFHMPFPLTRMVRMEMEHATARSRSHGR